MTCKLRSCFCKQGELQLGNCDISVIVHSQARYSDIYQSVLPSLNPTTSATQVTLTSSIASLTSVAFRQSSVSTWFGTPSLRSHTSSCSRALPYLNCFLGNEALLRHFTSSSCKYNQSDDDDISQKYWETQYRERMKETAKADSASEKSANDQLAKKDYICVLDSSVSGKDGFNGTMPGRLQEEKQRAAHENVISESFKTGIEDSDGSIVSEYKTLYGRRMKIIQDLARPNMKNSERLCDDSKKDGRSLKMNKDEGRERLDYSQVTVADGISQVETAAQAGKEWEEEQRNLKGSRLEKLSSKLTHTDSTGKAEMVDVGNKPVTDREAHARGKILLGPVAFALVRDNKMKKGDVLTVAQLAGILAAKKTSELIPLCHNIAITKADVKCRLNEADFSVEVEGVVRTKGVTGVEMEALTAVAVATLTVYDMCKAVTREMVIGDIQLLKKTGGARGDYRKK